MKHAWTAGQYSFFRAIFGTYLLVHFAHLAPWAKETFSSAGVLPDGAESPLFKLFPNVLLLSDAPPVPAILVSSAAVAALFFIFGYKDKIAAVWMWYVLACVFGRNPLTSNPSLPFVGWILLAHCIIPSAPFGSIDFKKKDIEEQFTWNFPEKLYWAAWVLMSLAYCYSGVMKLSSPSWVDGSAFFELLNNPLARPSFLRDYMLLLPPIAFKIMTWGALGLEIFFPLFIFNKQLRCFAWVGMLMMHFGLICLVQFADLSFGMVMLHLFTFDPAWLSLLQLRGKPTLFYDGSCGLCHRWVSLVLSEDRDSQFTFAPLLGESFREKLSAEQQDGLPDSIVLFEDGKDPIVRSTAVVRLLKYMGGYWTLCGYMLQCIPSPLRDAGYDFIASVRHKLYAKPKDACPMLPAELREQFLS